jgi:hypothetical protein
MSDPGTGGGPQPPPPGWQPPAPPAPSYTGLKAATPGFSADLAPGAWAPTSGMLGAAHKPGAMPLRPLGLGDLYDAAFRIIRFNPKATVGSAVIVASVVFLLPALAAAALSSALDLSLNASGANGDDQAIDFVASLVSIGVRMALLAFATILVTGMVAHVTAAAAVGRRLTIGEAWSATHGKRWRLLGLAFLLGSAVLLLLAGYVLLWVLVDAAAGGSVLATVFWGMFSVPAFACLMVWFWVRVYYLPVAALMLEPVGIFGALGRGFRLTRRQFWRTFGIALLTWVVVQISAVFLGMPVGIIGELSTLVLGSQYTLLVLLATQGLSQVVAAAFVTPFAAGVTSLQYLDQRMRKEAYDVELMQQAGITGS